MKLIYERFGENGLHKMEKFCVSYIAMQIELTSQTNFLTAPVKLWLNKFYEKCVLMTYQKTSIYFVRNVVAKMYLREFLVNYPKLQQLLISAVVHPMHIPHKFVTCIILGLFPMMWDESLCKYSKKHVKINCVKLQQKFCSLKIVYFVLKFCWYVADV